MNDTSNPEVAECNAKIRTAGWRVGTLVIGGLVLLVVGAAALHKGRVADPPSAMVDR